MTSIRITLPLPDKDVRPNGRCCRGKKLRLVKEHVLRAKDAAYIELVKNGVAHLTGFWTHASVQYDWYHPTTRLLDRDNIIGACKPYLDGIVRCGVLVDDNHVTVLPVGRFTDARDPRVEITITPTQEPDDE